MQGDSLQRHDLVFFSRASIEEIVQGAMSLQKHVPEEVWKAMAAQIGGTIPGIVRRQSGARAGYIDVGFSAPWRSPAGRYRFWASVPVADIHRVVTPLAAMDIAAARKGMDALFFRTLSQEAEKCGVAVGLWGSHALAAVTGLPYVSLSSDVDLLVQGDVHALECYGAALAALEQKFRIPMDAEARVTVVSQAGVALPFDIKLRELLSQSRYMLGKGLHETALLERGTYRRVSVQTAPAYSIEYEGY